MKKIMTLGIIAISFNLGLSAIDNVFMANEPQHDNVVIKRFPTGAPTAQEAIQAQREQTMLGQGGAGTRQMMGSDSATRSPNKRIQNNTNKDIVVRLEMSKDGQQSWSDIHIAKGSFIDIPVAGLMSVTPINQDGTTLGQTINAHQPGTININF